MKITGSNFLETECKLFIATHIFIGVELSLELSCGVDIIEIKRIKKAVESNQDKFLSKVFTQKEIEYCENRAAVRYQHYAARFAAKEAVVKALGIGFSQGIWWTEIEVIKDVNGRPAVKLYGNAQKAAEKMGIKSLNLSLSHCHDYAVASATCFVDTMTGENK